jgi:hypothetical protein
MHCRWRRSNLWGLSHFNRPNALNLAFHTFLLFQTKSTLQSYVLTSVLMSSNLLNQLSADERWIVTGAIVRTVIIAFVLIVRFSCKLTRKQRDMRLGWDDFWIVFAVALNWTGEVLTAWSTYAFYFSTYLCTVSISTDTFFQTWSEPMAGFL